MPAQQLNAAQRNALDNALEMAAGAEDIDMMNSAMDSGADPNYLLFEGIRKGRLSWIETAVTHGADVKASHGSLVTNDWREAEVKYPVFHWLNKYFVDEKIGDFLLSKGADVDLKDERGNSALMHAIKEGLPAPAQFLAKRGADPMLLCAGNDFPLQAAEKASWNSSTKLSLVKVLVESMQRTKRGDAPAASAVPANDAGAVATASDIELSKPIEFKKKPPPHHGGLEL